MKPGHVVAQRRLVKEIDVLMLDAPAGRGRCSPHGLSLQAQRGGPGSGGELGRDIVAERSRGADLEGFVRASSPAPGASGHKGGHGLASSRTNELASLSRSPDSTKAGRGDQPCLTMHACPSPSAGLSRHDDRRWKAL